MFLTLGIVYSKIKMGTFIHIFYLEFKGRHQSSKKVWKIAVDRSCLYMWGANIASTWLTTDMFKYANYQHTPYSKFFITKFQWLPPFPQAYSLDPTDPFPFLLTAKNSALGWEMRRKLRAGKKTLSVTVRKLNFLI